MSQKIRSSKKIKWFSYLNEKGALIQTKTAYIPLFIERFKKILQEHQLSDINSIDTELLVGHALLNPAKYELNYILTKDDQVGVHLRVKKR
jgi:hypothetical protein